MSSNVFGEGGDAGVRKKSSTRPLLLLHSIESQLTQEEEKVGILKIIPPLKSFIIQKYVHENLNLLHLFLPLCHESLGSDLTNTSCFLTNCSTSFFFHCSCKIYTSKVIEALHFEGREGGGREECICFEALCSRGCHPHSSLAYLLSLLKGTKRTVKTSSAARQHLLQIP